MMKETGMSQEELCASAHYMNLCYQLGDAVYNGEKDRANKINEELSTPEMLQVSRMIGEYRKKWESQ